MAFATICVVVTIALLEFVWLKVPWEWIHLSLCTFVYRMAALLQSCNRWLFLEVERLVAIVGSHMRTVALSVLGSLRSAAHAFLELPPVDTPITNDWLGATNYQ
ncbi:hypothetical protein M404DRAFT_36220 [Pisolithus tinctorius Marx 270]|uniref:Uncharacterized protein n=1 Tax=Pisolithus tinctorius Marx 270 TaxID=870435 RepID=A0A0C3I831_PISTI|nr:hypothetical protein M404DRAFT_36220 [Pisolithus tinctorius Marx 270]